MIDKHALCEKIKQLYPDVGACGIDIRVDYDDDEKSLVVYLKKGNREVKHFLPDADAVSCMDGQQCVALGIEVAQFKDYAHA